MSLDKRKIGDAGFLKNYFYCKIVCHYYNYKEWEPFYYLWFFLNWFTEGIFSNNQGVSFIKYGFLIVNESGRLIKLNSQHEKSRFRGLCDPEEIQTLNLLIRSQMLYSVKLRDLIVFKNANIAIFYLQEHFVVLIVIRMKYFIFYFVGNLY